MIPDLLNLKARVAVDERSLVEVLGLAAFGQNVGLRMEETLAGSRFETESCWQPEFFESDLFVSEFVSSLATLEIGDISYPVNQSFLVRALVHTPVDLPTIHFRQEIVRELHSRDELRQRVERLYHEIFTLVTLFKSPGYQATLDATGHHLEILKQIKVIIDSMASGFVEAQSGLHRLYSCAAELQEAEAYLTLSDLLAYESGMAELNLEVKIGADGRIRNLEVLRLLESRGSRFYRRPLQRLMDRFRLFLHGYEFTSKELVNRMTQTVFRSVAPSLAPLVQLLGHLEFYLINLAFRRRAEGLGFEVELAELAPGNPPRLVRLFNPLLMHQERPPVTCTLRFEGTDPIVIITGPNSGGKTRLLQAVGLAQLLAQSGLYAPAAEARLQVASGLFVSLVEDESAHQTEGRLGRELVRLRSLFERVQPGAMVILDELCSGTNPSEGVEVFSLVLRLLDKVCPTAFLATHFLDFARSLEESPVVPGLEFRQVEVDDHQSSTYQFVDGVASTSLASLTAMRLGVTFERLSALLERRERPEVVSD